MHIWLPCQCEGFRGTGVAGKGGDKVEYGHRAKDRKMVSHSDHLHRQWIFSSKLNGECAVRVVR